MSISRDDAAIYLDEQFSAYASSIGQDTEPTVGYSPDINNALRAMGVLEDDLVDAVVTDGLRNAFFVLCEYYAARRFWRRLGDRVDHTMGETRFDFRDQRKSIKEIMEDASRRAMVLGYDVALTGKVPLFKVY